ARYPSWSPGCAPAPPGAPARWPRRGGRGTAARWVRRCRPRFDPFPARTLGKSWECEARPPELVGLCRAGRRPARRPVPWMITFFLAGPAVRADHEPGLRDGGRATPEAADDRVDTGRGRGNPPRRAGAAVGPGRGPARRGGRAGRRGRFRRERNPAREGEGDRRDPPARLGGRPEGRRRRAQGPARPGGPRADTDP